MKNTIENGLSDNMQLNLLSQIPMAIIAVDNNLMITYVNDEFETVMSCNRNDLFGTNTSLTTN